MQLSIPPQVLAANRTVLDSLGRAAANADIAQVRTDGQERVPAGIKSLVDSAFQSAVQALEGVEALGAGNLLDDTFQRYAQHSVRHLGKAAEMLARPGQLSRDAMAILNRTLFDAEVATRLGSEAGERSLATPSPKALIRATEFAGGDSTSSSGPVWVDGEWLDGLGNPVRGDGTGWTGPDGDGYGWDGTPDRGGSGDTWVGPDGQGYSGI